MSCRAGMRSRGRCARHAAPDRSRGPGPPRGCQSTDGRTRRAPGEESNSFSWAGNMVLLSPAGNRQGRVAIGPERVTLVHAARIPQYPRLDSQFLGRAYLLANLMRRITRLAASQREGLQIGTNGRGFGVGTRPLYRFAESIANDSVWLAVRPRQPVAAAIVMAGIHHRQNDVGNGDEVFPHLSDAKIAGRRCGQT